MATLSLQEVRSLLAMVIRAMETGSATSLPDRKRRLVAEVAELIDADIWLWTTFTVREDDPGNAVTVEFFDGGWQSLEERFRAFELFSDARLQRVQGATVRDLRDQPTIHSHDTLAPELREESRELFRGIGIEHLLLAPLRLSGGLFSSMVFYRRLGRVDFSERDRAILLATTEAVSLLQLNEFDDEVAAATLRLSPRERQVLVFLLDGYSTKEIATAAKISPHTVGDYIKSIHKKFSVSSRAELLSLFISGEKSGTKFE